MLHIKRMRLLILCICLATLTLGYSQKQIKDTPFTDNSQWEWSCDSLIDVNKHNRVLVLLQEKDSLDAVIKDLYRNQRFVLKRIDKAIAIVDKRSGYESDSTLLLKKLGQIFNENLNSKIQMLFSTFSEALGLPLYSYTTEWFLDSYVFTSTHKETNMLKPLKLYLLVLEDLYLKKYCRAQDCIKSRIVVKFDSLDKSLEKMLNEAEYKTDSILKVIQDKVQLKKSSEANVMLVGAERLNRATSEIIDQIEVLKGNIGRDSIVDATLLTDKLDKFKDTLEYLHEVQINRESIYMASKRLSLSSDSLAGFIDSVKHLLVVESGGLDSNGMPKGMKNTRVTSAMFLNQNGQLSELANDYLNQFHKHQAVLDQVINDHLSDSLLNEYKLIDFDLKDVPSRTDYIRLSFDGTPMIAALSYLTEKQFRVSRFRAEILLLLEEKGEGYKP